MKLYKKLNKHFNYNYYNYEEIIPENEYNRLNNIIRGGEAISLDNLKIKTYIRKIIFRHEFIYDFILPILNEYNTEINKLISNNLNMYVTGNTSLIINLDDYKDKFTENEFEIYYKLFEKSDIDVNVIINLNDLIHNNSIKNYKNTIRILTQKLLYKYKHILLNNQMFMYYIRYYIIDYLKNDDEFMKNNDIKSIRKNKMYNQIKYENKNIKSLNDDNILSDIFIRINEELRFNKDEMIDLYRIMVPYQCELNNTKNIISIWAELIDITIKEIKINYDINYIKTISDKIEQIINIFNENIRQNKTTNIEDIPKTNDTFNITQIMWLLSKDNTLYIHQKFYNNLYINSLTLKGYIYENILIILNTPNDPKTYNRINRITFILNILKKH